MRLLLGVKLQDTEEVGETAGVNLLALQPGLEVDVALRQTEGGI